MPPCHREDQTVPNLGRHVLDGRYVAPFQNEGDSKFTAGSKIEAKFRTFPYRVKFRKELMKFWCDFFVPDLGGSAQLSGRLDVDY